VFKDCDTHFETRDGELILYSPDYPEGYPTGDLGIIEEDNDEYQMIGIDILRKDGRIKHIVCKRGV